MILIHPFAKPLSDGGINPKSPPVEWWKEVASLLDEDCLQIAVESDPLIGAEVKRGLPLKEIERLISEAETFISVDSFLPHLANFQKKRGVVVFSQSDPEIFGYPYNVNLLKDRKYLRKNQFATWSETPYVKEAFVEPKEVVNAVKGL